MDSNSWYRGTKAVDFRSVLGIAGGSAGLLNGTTRLFSLSLLHFEPLHRARLGHGLWLAALRSGVFLGRPFCEFGPAVSDIELGVLGRHFDRAIETDIDVPAREGLYGAGAWRRLQSNIPCASSFSGPLCGSQEEPPVWPPPRRRVGPAQGASPLEPPPRLGERPRGLQPRQLPQ